MSFKISTHNFTLCAAISNHEHKLSGFRKKCMLIKVKGTLKQLFALSTVKWEKRSHLMSHQVISIWPPCYQVTAEMSTGSYQDFSWPWLAI